MFGALQTKAGAQPAAYSMRALARMLTYPDQGLRELVPDLQKVLFDEAALSPNRLRGLSMLLSSWLDMEVMEVEQGYVDLFDRGRATSLHLFEHVHGDSRDRGPAMIDLVKTYEQGGLLLDPDKIGGELPDYLPVVLEFASTLPASQMREFIGEIAHILNAIHAALLKRAVCMRTSWLLCLRSDNIPWRAWKCRKTRTSTQPGQNQKPSPVAAARGSKALISLNPSRSCGGPHRPPNEEHQHEPLSSIHLRHLSLHLRRLVHLWQPDAL